MVVLLLADFEVVDCVLVEGIEAVAWSAARAFACCVLAVLLDVVVGLDDDGLLLSFVSFELSRPSFD